MRPHDVFANTPNFEVRFVFELFILVVVMVAYKNVFADMNSMCEVAESYTLFFFNFASFGSNVRINYTKSY